MLQLAQMMLKIVIVLVSQTRQSQGRFSLVDRKFCKKARLNRKNLANLGNSKYQCYSSTKIFVNENSTSMNNIRSMELKVNKSVHIANHTYRFC